MEIAIILSVVFLLVLGEFSNWLKKVSIWNLQRVKKRKKPEPKKEVLHAVVRQPIQPVQMMRDYLGLKLSAVMATQTRRHVKQKRVMLLPHFH